MDVSRKQEAATVAAEREQSLFSRYIERLRGRSHPVREAVLDLLSAFIAFCLSGTAVLFSAVPMGIGLFCAKKKRLPATAVGLLVGTALLGYPGLVYATLYLLAAGLRMLFSIPGEGRKILPDCEGFFREAPELRLATACICGIVAAGYQMLIGGFTTSVLLFSAMMVFGCPAICGAFCGFFDKAPSFEVLSGAEALPKEKLLDRLRWQGGFLAIGFCTALSLNAYSFFGISLSFAFITLFTLYAARRFGPVHGLLAGGVCALSCTFVYAPAFALFGVLTGVLWQLGAFFALGLGLAAAAVWSSFVGGLSGFLSVFPETAAVTLLSWPFLPKISCASAGAREDNPKKLSESVVREIRQTKTPGPEIRLMRLSGAFSSLSKLFSAYQEATETPDRQTCRTVCADACGRRCGACDKYDECWESDELPGAELLEAAAQKMEAGEPLDKSIIPDKLRAVCTDSEALAEDIRTAAGAFLREKTKGENEAILEYEVVAEMLREAVRNDRAFRREDPKLSAEVRRVLRSYGCKADAVSVLGQKKKYIVAAGIEKMPADATLPQLRRELEAVCGCRFGAPAVGTEQGYGTLELTTERRLSVTSAFAMRAANPEEISGDTVRFFETPDDTFCALLSDGMGSGKDAASASGVCTVFLEKMLSAGCGKTIAVKMLNRLLRSSLSERSATLDLLELDLLHGEASFLKGGAAPSYIKRGTQLFRIRSKTIPLGLMKSPDTEKIRFHVEPGDVIVLLSDGISQTPEESPWLNALLSASWEGQELQEMAEKILASASENNKGDDMTVALVLAQGVTQEGLAYGVA